MKPSLLVAAILGVAGVVGTALSARAQSSTQKLPSRTFCTADSKGIAVTPQTLFLYVNGQPRYFCSPQCRDKFASFPEKFVKETVKCTVQPNFKGYIQTGRRAEVNNGLYYLCCEPCVGWMRDKPWLYLKELQDPVTGKWFKPAEESPRSTVDRQVYLFENAQTKADFDKEPQKYAVQFRR